MRKNVQVALAAAVVVLLVATGVLYSKYRNTNALYASSRAAEAESQARYGRTLDAIAEIQDSLNAISQGSDNNVSMLSKTLSSERHLSNAEKADALDRIADLRGSIMRSKQRINQLESSLHASGIKVASLNRMLAGLKKNLSEREEMVASLTGRVDSLQTQVTTLATTVQEREDTLHVRDLTIEDRRRENATVYYVAGNKKDLAQKGVVIAKGGVLGLGKTLLPASTTSAPAAFNPVDTDQQTTIDLNAAKARVLSAQPADSYELRLVDGKMQLHILNPVEFRKIKQVVILTA